MRRDLRPLAIEAELLHVGGERRWRAGIVRTAGDEPDREPDHDAAPERDRSQPTRRPLHDDRGARQGDGSREDVAQAVLAPGREVRAHHLGVGLAEAAVRVGLEQGLHFGVRHARRIPSRHEAGHDDPSGTCRRRCAPSDAARYSARPCRRASARSHAARSRPAGPASRSISSGSR